MLRSRLIPCLLLKDGALVKTKKFKRPAYVGDPVNTIRIFNELEVDEICVLGIDITTNGRDPPFELLRDLASECFMPLSYGGGIRSLEHAKRLFSIGIEKICINTAAFENEKLVSDITREYGSQSTIVSIDVKSDWLKRQRNYIRSGTLSTPHDPIVAAKLAESWGAGEILLTSIDREGTMAGLDLRLIESVCGAVGIPVIAHGGAGETGDWIEAVKLAGASAVAAGSLFVYQNTNRSVLVNYPSQAEISEALEN